MKNRREFLIGSLAFSAGLLSCCKHSILRDNNESSSIPDIKSLSYCCLDCQKCPAFKATANNDLKLKQRIAERRSKESGKTVTADEVSCYGCKQKGKQCGIIDCAKGRNIDSCSLCVDLEKCSQNYWKDFPSVRTRALEIQKIVMKNNKT
jgi:hypothetical protein